MPYLGHTSNNPRHPRHPRHSQNVARPRASYVAWSWYLPWSMDPVAIPSAASLTRHLPGTDGTLGGKKFTQENRADLGIYVGNILKHELALSLKCL